MSKHNVWTHKGTFLLAAVGSAVGLGNLWRFLVRFVAPAAVAFVFLRSIPQVEDYLIPTIGALVIIGAFAAGRTFLVEDSQAR